MLPSESTVWLSLGSCGRTLAHSMLTFLTVRQVLLLPSRRYFGTERGLGWAGVAGRIPALANGWAFVGRKVCRSPLVSSEVDKGWLFVVASAICPVRQGCQGCQGQDGNSRFLVCWWCSGSNLLACGYGFGRDSAGAAGPGLVRI